MVESQIVEAVPLHVRLWHLCMAACALLDFASTLASDYLSSREIVSDQAGSVAWRDALYLLERHSNTFGFAFSLMWFLDALLTSRTLALGFEREIATDETSTDHHKDRRQGSRGTFLFTTVIQLLLLPTGFCLYLFEVIRKIISRTDSLPLASVDSSKANAKPSLLFTALVHSANSISRRTGILVKRNGIRYALRRATRHPLRFVRLIRQILHIIRWASYLGPIAGASTQLFETVQVLMKKLRQRRKEAAAKTARKKLMQQMSGREFREHSATIIQKTYRSHRIRKRVHALKLILLSKKELAARKVQRVLRRSLARVRARLLQKKKDLEKLQRRHQDKDGSQLDALDLGKMYSLEKELRAETMRLLNQKLLLRPDTTFAVVWKAIFVVAVSFEILRLAYQPVRRSSADIRNGHSSGLETVLRNLMLPVPVVALPSCSEKPKQLLVVRSFLGLVKRLSRANEAAQPQPWFCSERYAQIQNLYIQVVGLTINRFLVIVRVICFLDVFVDFFTGDIDETGLLVPRPFFQRWVIPGLLLQLLFNPQMESTSVLVGKFLRRCIRHGPERVLRWTVALFYPSFLLLWKDLLLRLYPGVWKVGHNLIISVHLSIWNFEDGAHSQRK